MPYPVTCMVIKYGGMGWLPDQPDFRDYTFASPELAGIAKKLKLNSVDATTIPTSADISKYCSPVEDQGQLGSCTANAAAGLIEYGQRKAYGKHVDMSRLFIYKVTRDYLGMKGDSGAYLRSVMGAIRIFGAPPESYWPYNVKKYDTEPTAFLYSFAKEYQSINYARLDPLGTPAATVLNNVKTNIANGLPVMFGFTCYDSLYKVGADGKIFFPSSKEQVVGGHAIDIVGYDDKLIIKNPTDGISQTGAFKIRNSWGTSWGQAGYGWLPYQYVTAGLADDFWTVIDEKWVDTGAFNE